jgi:hypothetical protein
MATSFSGGRSRSTRREPPTMGKHLENFKAYPAVNFITPWMLLGSEIGSGFVINKN